MLAQHYVSQYEMKTGLYFPYVILGFIFIWIEKWLLSPKIITNTKPVLKLVKLICGALTQNSSTYLNSKSFDLGEGITISTIPRNFSLGPGKKVNALVMPW